MGYQVVDDFTQMRVDDLLERRCPTTGIVVQWRVVGVHLGAVGFESLIAIQPITNRLSAADGPGPLMVPEPMTRDLTIVRPVEQEGR